MSQPSSPDSRERASVVEHAVVVATTHRSCLRRALESIRVQSVTPQAVIVVVDRDEAVRKAVESECQTVLQGVQVIRNDRMPGASGAWNTALDRLARDADRRMLFVSFLDDDDWWEADHLEAVSSAAVRGALVVATSIVRHDAASKEGALLHPPAALEHDAFLRGNPGIQGSNLSARLWVLLEAGMFDEALRSCTDRDMCIRLADLGVRYEGVRAGHIHHDATGNDRLSTPGSEAKCAGLDVFHAKHAWRMTPAQERAFLERGRALFDWTPSPRPTEVACPPRDVQTADRMAWVVAAIIDSEEPARARPFLADVARLAAHERVDGLTVVLLQNGPTEGFAGIVEHARSLGLFVRPAAEPEVRRAGSALLGIAAGELGGKKSIAVARSVLQQIAYEAARGLARPVVWIADDDVRLPPSLDLFVDDVARARAAGLDAAIGMVAGAPPVPAATTLRTQLVDLVAFLRGAAIRDPEARVPDVDLHNGAWRAGRRDYYYDLVRRQTDRLETPFLPRTRATTLGAAVAEVLDRAPRMLAGEQIFRPVMPDADDLEASLRRAMSDRDGKDEERSLTRGGNTFVFDVDLLRDVPNLSPSIGGRRLRRSDTLWALLARHRSGRSIHMVPIFVKHDRSQERAQGLDPDKLFDDVLGYGFSRALGERLPRHRGDLFEPPRRQEIAKRAAKLARERVAEMRLSCFRIRGLARALDRLLDEGAPCGLDEERMRALRELAATLRRDFAESAFQDLEARFQSVQEDRGFEAYFGAVEAHERRTAARRCGEERLGRALDEVLGSGEEGVVFRAGDRIVKVFDRWSEQDRAAHAPTLRALQERPADEALPRVLAVHDDATPVIIEMEREDGEPFVGGRGPELVALLRALRASGWACTNLHPKNLLATPRGLRVIDVGRSIVPFSPAIEELAARRALLAMRCVGRADLAQLMTRSLQDGALPELEGVTHLLDAVRGEDCKVTLDEAVARAVRAFDPGHLLDFGCGKPRPWLARIGDVRVTAFDPDPSLAERWKRDAPHADFLDEAALDLWRESGPRVDVVVCSLVLCTLDATGMAKALARVRRLVRDGGTVLVAVCDPRAALVERTARHLRLLPEGAEYERSFTYAKRVLRAVPRVEHHRAMSAYKSAFFDAGLEVVAEHVTFGVDTDRFVPVPEFVLFELAVRSSRPAEGPLKLARPSLPPALADLTVLSYHRVAEERPSDPAIALHRARGMVVSPAVFAAQMRSLRRFFEPVGAEDIVRAARGRGALPRRAAWVTFDDGYRDLVDHVAPILERERVPATFFARVPGPDGLPSWAPLDLCYQVLARAPVPDPRALVPQGEERERLLSGRCVDQIRWVLSLAAKHRVDLTGVRRGDLYASADELERLRARGFSIGAHGTEHERWTALDDDDLERAVRRSMDWLDRAVGAGVPCVAYPDAAFDARVARAVERAGFVVGVGLEASPAEGVAPRLALRRAIARDDERWIETLASGASLEDL
ncbi:MAG: polysaccharide deacetylase family protein [Polyangiaceae bacterium]